MQEHEADSNHSYDTEEKLRGKGVPFMPTSLQGVPNRSELDERRSKKDFIEAYNKSTEEVAAKYNKTLEDVSKGRLNPALLREDPIVAHRNVKIFPSAEIHVNRKGVQFLGHDPFVTYEELLEIAKEVLDQQSLREQVKEKKRDREARYRENKRTKEEQALIDDAWKEVLETIEEVKKDESEQSTGQDNAGSTGIREDVLESDKPGS